MKKTRAIVEERRTGVPRPLLLILITIFLLTGCSVNTAGSVQEVASYSQIDQEMAKQMMTRDDGHAEAVRVDYDPDVISLTDLLNYYFMVIDPLSVNKQGNDRGIQYRTGIYYTEEDQLPEIEAVYRAEEEKAGARLAVELLPLENFFPAEEYHQKYLDKNPGGYCHIPRSYFDLQ